MRSNSVVRLLSITAVFLASLALPGRAFADDAPPVREGLGQAEIPGDMAKDFFAEYGITFGAGISFSYQYGFNDPSSKALGLRLVDKDHDAFGLDLGQLTFKRDATEPGAFGFMLQPAFGRYAKRFKSDWDGSGVFNDTDWENNEVEIQQVYVAYDAPIGSGLLLKLGKFNTLVGSEVNEPWNNPIYSRQLLYSLCQPAIHTGGLASYVVNETVNVTVGGITGWDVVKDNNGRPAFIGQLGLTPDPAYVFYFSTIVGPEIPNNDRDIRFLFDYVSTIKPFGDQFAIITNLDYGHEQSSHLTNVGDDATFWGISNTFVYTVVPPVDLIYRAEWFEDGGGIRTGARQRVWEMTGAVKWRVTQYLYVRAEYRHDESDGEPFPSGDALTSQGQDVVAADFGYFF